MTFIEDITMRKILDSRGSSTVEVEIYTTEGFVGAAAAPSGKSTGKHEVMAFGKKGIDESMRFFHKKVLPEIIGMDTTAQREVDELLCELDGTDKFEKLSGNAAVAISLANAKAAAASLGMPLFKYLGGAMSWETPFPFGNVLGGGAHAIGGPDIQEFMAVSMGDTVMDSVFANAAVHDRVSTLLEKEFPDTAIGKGDEGAWVAPATNEKALEIVSQACKDVSKKVKFPIKPALDVASSEFFKKGRYVYKDRKRDTEEQIQFIAELVDRFEIHSVEDPLHEDDFKGYSQLTDEIGDKCLVVGDDLFVTNLERLEKGIDQGCANAILIKPNQIGTLTDTYDTLEFAHHCGYETVMSHRSGETPDPVIAHLAVAFGCHGIKTGAVGGERVAKLNELIRIEDELFPSFPQHG